MGGEALGYNLYSYCQNNPINMSDSAGNWPRWITKAVAIAAKVVSVVASVSGNSIMTSKFNKISNVASTAYVIQSLHYDLRAEKNVGVPSNYEEAKLKEGADTSVSAACHQFTAGEGENKKVCWPDGTEGIYDSAGNIVTDPRDIGTYNFFVPDNTVNSVMHGVFDVVPWIIFGNSDRDPGPIYNYPAMWFDNIIELFE